MNFSTALFPELSDYATDAAIALRHAKIAFSEWFEIPYPSFTTEANTREIEIIQRTSDLLKEQG